MRASGSSLASFASMLWMVSISLCTKYTWPPRLSSRSTASRIWPSEKRDTKVLMASRRCGAVAITEKSRRPSSDIARVRGIGVAVSVRTSTSARSALSRSLWRTPKRCSSSTITRPRFLNLTLSWISLWVPMTMSISPFASASSDGGLLLGGAEARQLGDLHRPVGEAVAEGLEVLLGQQRGGHQHRHLLAVGDRDEGRAQRHLGLAEADVAAYQPVHRLAGRQVLDHRIDGGLLVARLLEREAVGERLVVLGLELERVALARRALRIDVEQLRRGIAHLLGGLALGLLPLAAAQLVQRCGLRRRTAVAADDLQLRHRHVELVAAVVFEGEELGHALAEVHVDEAEVAADAVAACAPPGRPP